MLLISFTGCNDTAEQTTGEQTTVTTQPPSAVEENLLNIEDFTFQNLPDKVIFDNELYTITRTNGKSYLTVKENNNDVNSVSNSVEPMTVIGIFHLEFNSLDELIDLVVGTGLSKSDLNWLELSEYVNPEGQIEICDFERIYEPVLSSIMEANELSWRGTDIIYRYTPQDPNYSSCEMRVGSFAAYYLKSELSNMPDKRYKEPVITEEVTHYDKDHYRCGVYEFERNGISYTVFSKTRQRLPEVYEITIFGEIGDVTFKYDVKLNSFEYGEKCFLDKDWIDDFRVKLYKPEEK